MDTDCLYTISQCEYQVQQEKIINMSSVKKKTEVLFFNFFTNMIITVRIFEVYIIIILFCSFHNFIQYFIFCFSRNEYCPETHVLERLSNKKYGVSSRSAPFLFKFLFSSF